MKKIRFSVITICFNDLAGLTQTKASVDAQSHSDFEWIIVDGGSKDGTLLYLQSLNRLECRWASEPDEGIFDAMNKGLDLAIGEYVIFMNSGDRFASSDILSRLDAIVTQSREPSALMFGDAYEDTLGGLLLKPARPARAIKRGMFTHHQAMVYARNAVGSMRYDTGFRVAGDYHFTSRLLAKGGCSFYVGFPVCIFQRSGFSESHAAVGRRENLVVQKNVLRLSRMRRGLNYMSFLIFAFMRTYMRGFYDRVRFRRVIAPHGIG